MANLDKKQLRIINALLELKRSIDNLIKLTTNSYPDFLKVLLKSEASELYDSLTTDENLKLLNLTTNIINDVKADKKAIAIKNTDKARQKKEQKRKEQQEEKEKKQLEELKKKYQEELEKKQQEEN